MKWLSGVPLVVVIAAMSTLGAAVDARQARSVWEGVYTDEQAHRGKTLYHDVCESCHAPDLSGGKEVPELVGETFAARWRSLTVGELFERVLLSMPAADPSSVSRQDKADIVAFILWANGFPTGDQELPDQAEIVSRFVFEAAKP